MYRLIILMLAVLLLAAAVPTQPIHAQGPRLQLPSCIKDGNCGVNDILNTIVSAGKFFQAIAGALALALFVYGGTIMLLSGGRAEWVTKGKAALTAAVIGLIIVLGAFVIVRTIESALKGQAPTGAGPGAAPDAACRALSGGGFEHSCVTLSAEERDRRIEAGECVAGLCPGGSNNVCCANASGSGGAVAPGELCRVCTCTDRSFTIGSDVPVSICLGPLYRNFCSYHPRPGGEPICER